MLLVEVLHTVIFNSFSILLEKFNILIYPRIH